MHLANCSFYDATSQKAGEATHQSKNDGKQKYSFVFFKISFLLYLFAVGISLRKRFCEDSLELSENENSCPEYHNK